MTGSKPGWHAKPHPDATPQWSHDTMIITQVLALGVCQWVRPLDAPNRPGEVCGMIHTRCAGHIKGTAEHRRHKRGDPCGMRPCAGCTHCKRHGGGAPQVRKKGKERVMEEAAKTAAVTFGLPVDIDAGDALIAELHQAKGLTEWYLAALRQAVEITKEPEPGAEPVGLTWAKHEHRKGTGPEGPVDVTTYRAAAPILYELYDHERRYLVDVATRCLKAGIDERRTRLAEAAGIREAKLMAAFADALGLDLQAPETRAAVERAFTVIDGGAAA